jgi:hypothetical protein
MHKKKQTVRIREEKEIREGKLVNEDSKKERRMYKGGK